MFLVLAQVSFDAIFESNHGGEQWVTTPWGKCSPPRYLTEWECHLDDHPGRNVDWQEEAYARCIYQANRIDLPEFGE